MFREWAVLGGLVLVGAYGVGALGGSTYDRTVDRPPAQVAAALDDLDITKQPGSPGTDPAAAGGVKPTFRHERTPTGVVLTVMSGNAVATRMFADLTPLDGGRRTKVTARVERGDAPDDLTSPAFRSHAITYGLFSMALDDQLGRLTQPTRLSAERCREMLEDWRMRGEMERIDGGAGSGPLGAFGEAAGNMVKLHALEGKLRAAGCDTSGTGKFQPVEQQMLPG